MSWQHFVCLFIALTSFSALQAKQVKLFLSGDVMLGRGIDQILPHPSNPQIYESYMKSALGYVKIASDHSGPISRPVSYSYIWGDALRVFDQERPDVRIINLETSITKSETHWIGKGINYRMHPKNIEALSIAKIDYCSLANNHTIDWGYDGLTETIQTLSEAGISYGGAGENLAEASAPKVFKLSDNRKVVVISYGMLSSGIPYSWRARPSRAGVSLLTSYSSRQIEEIRQLVMKYDRRDTVIVFSIHWGGNWGYEISSTQREFAHNLIDKAGVDVIIGHSSHHPKGIEIYRNKPIIYGTGDLINDYEGIGGHSEFRGDLSLMYFITMDLEHDKLSKLKMIPTQMKRFQIKRASKPDSLWLGKVLTREGKNLGTKAMVSKDNSLILLKK